MSSLSPKVNIVKYIPFSLRLERPTKRASKKLIRPPRPITTARATDLPELPRLYAEAKKCG